MEQIEEGKVICLIMDQLINDNNKFLNDKTKLYCEYCLSLDKDYVNSIVENFYERCENYLKKFIIKNSLEMVDMRNMRLKEI